MGASSTFWYPFHAAHSELMLSRQCQWCQAVALHHHPGLHSLREEGLGRTGSRSYTAPETAVSARVTKRMCRHGAEQCSEGAGTFLYEAHAVWHTTSTSMFCISFIGCRDMGTKQPCAHGTRKCTWSLALQDGVLCQAVEPMERTSCRTGPKILTLNP